MKNCALEATFLLICDGARLKKCSDTHLILPWGFSRPCDFSASGNAMRRSIFLDSLKALK
jgi:hypothetical protein